MAEIYNFIPSRQYVAIKELTIGDCIGRSAIDDTKELWFKQETDMQKSINNGDSMSIDQHFIHENKEEMPPRKPILPNTVLRVKEVKVATNEVTSYAMTVEKFIDLANKGHYLGFARYFATKPPSLEQQLMEAVGIHEELNRCVIVITAEQ